MKRIITAIVILFTTALFAQTNDTITKLDDVFISGIRSNKSTPVTTKIVYRSEIQKTSQSTEITSYLTKTPNITMSSDNGTAFGYTYFRLRGIDQTKINMTLNGAPLNDPEDQGAFFSNYPNFLDNIQSVEIQRGVGTSTNGVSSFAGSINILTPKNISNLVLAYEKDKLLIELVGRRQSKSYLDLGNTSTIGAFNVINDNIGYTFKSYSVLLSLNNLTSEKYYTNGNVIEAERQLFTNPKINGFITFKYIL